MDMERTLKPGSVNNLLESRISELKGQISDLNSILRSKLRKSEIGRVEERLRIAKDIYAINLWIHRYVNCSLELEDETL